MSYTIISNDLSSNLSPSKRGRKKGSKNFHSSQRRILEEYIKLNDYNLYPSEKEKSKLAREIKSSKKKISNWFINMRKVGKPWNFNAYR